MKKDKEIIRSTENIRKTRGSSKPEVIMPVPASLREMPAGYAALFAELKERIARERIKAVLSANSAMVLMYWDIGRSILERQHKEGWGAKVIDRLSHDLKTAFPDMTGLSPRNLKHMRKFAESWPERSIVQEVLAQITWYHNLALLERADDSKIRLWYANKTFEYGWSRNILAIQIEARLHERQGKAVNNFQAALPPADSDMAAQIFKDPYIFDFLGTADPRCKAELEQKLIDHIQKFLLDRKLSQYRSSAGECH
jgi:predicted nuclease of restriction endonuclease-like (RecB) superfamily